MSLRNRSAGRTSERGQALAEFALVLPLLLLLIAGIIEFARAWNIKQAVTDAAREGARYSVVQDGITNTLPEVKAKIEERLALASIETSSIVFSSTYPGCGDVTSCFRDTGKWITVDVSTQYRMAFVGALMKWLGGSPDVTISTRATMRNE
jgi:Flp pilus assembly protein TadG